MATAEFSKFAGILSAALSQHHLSGFEIAQLGLSFSFPGKNARVGCHILLQGIFLTQGLNLSLLYCRQILYHLSHQRCPNICLSATGKKEWMGQRQYLVR